MASPPTGPLGHPEQPTPETSSKAITSMILGFFFFFWPAAVLAVVFGHLARREIRRSGGRLKGSRRALTGLVFGYCGLILAIALAIVIFWSVRPPIPANEASAVYNLRNINTAAATYADTYHRGFPSSLKVLGPPAGGRPSDETGADLIDSVLAEGRKSGYSFRYKASTSRGDGPADTYTVNADPITPGWTGRRYFFTDQTGVIRFDTERPASAKSPPLP